MINFYDGGLADIWPGEKTPQIQALSFALQQAIKRVTAYADQAMCYSDIDHLPEYILDYFAVEMRSMYYEQTLPVEQKRNIVKNTLKWHIYSGTPETANEMVSTVFGDGEVVEWFDYKDWPYTPATFDIVSTAQITPTIYTEMEKYLDRVKNVRSHLRKIIFKKEEFSTFYNFGIVASSGSETIVDDSFECDISAESGMYGIACLHNAYTGFVQNHFTMDIDSSATQSVVMYANMEFFTEVKER